MVRKNAASKRGRMMAEARWSVHRAKLSAAIAAGKLRGSEFVIRLTHLPTGEWAEMEFRPDIGRRIALAVENFNR
jgi:hypothetical protein